MVAQRKPRTARSPTALPTLRLRCPSCGTIVRSPAVGDPVCPACGHGAAGPDLPSWVAAQGPWYTFGLGAGLLASNAALFFALVGLTYAVGIILLLWLLLVLLAMGQSTSSCGGCGDCGCGDCGCGGCGCGGCGCGGCGCGGCGGCGCMAPAPLFALTTAPAMAWKRLRAGALAHHPDLPAFGADVYRLAGVRFCVGCFTAYPMLLAASAVLLATGLPGSWWTGLALGLPLAALQALSALGLTRRRGVKVAVKTSLGLGLALAIHAILHSPWPRTFQVAALGALVVLGALSGLPRRTRICRASTGAQP